MEDNLTWQSTICTVLEYLRSSEANDMSERHMSDVDNCLEELIEYVRDYE